MAHGINAAKNGRTKMFTKRPVMNKRKAIAQEIREMGHRLYGHRDVLEPVFYGDVFSTDERQNQVLYNRYASAN